MNPWIDRWYDFVDAVKRQMVRLVVLLIVIGGLIIVGWTWWFSVADGPVITNYPPDGWNVVVFGDSLVKGTGSRTGEGFVGQLRERTGAQIMNEGKEGDTTQTALARIDAILTRQPDIAIILLGGNDAIRRIPEEETFANLEAIVQRFHDIGAVVVILGVQSGVFFDEYEDDFERLAEESGSFYIPNILEGWFNSPSLKADQIHPNEAGYRVITDRVAPVLNDILLDVQR